MLTVVESRGALEIRSRMPVGRRVFLLLLSLFPLLAPYELILRVDWEGYFNPVFLFVAAVSAGALCVSALLAWAALAGMSSRLRLDRTHGTVTYRAGAPLVPWRTTQCRLEDVAELGVVEHDWSDGAPSYSLVARTLDGRDFRAGSSWSREDIEAIARRASFFLQPSSR